MKNKEIMWFTEQSVNEYSSIKIGGITDEIYL